MQAMELSMARVESEKLWMMAQIHIRSTSAKRKSFQNLPIFKQYNDGLFAAAKRQFKLASSTR